MATVGTSFQQATIHGGLTKKIPTVSTISAGVITGVVKKATTVTQAKQSAQLLTKKATTTTKKKTTTTTTKKTTTKKKTTTTTTVTAKTTASTDIVKWSGGGGINFFVKPKKVMGVKDINIKASVDTEDKENGGEKYTVKKNKGGLEITMTAVLNAMLGVNVEGSAKAILQAARKGDTGYFYIAGKKLFTAKFMMTDANAKNVELTGDGRWVCCEVEMTLKQCSKYDGTTTSSKPQGSNKSGYKYSVTVYWSGSSGAIQSVVGYSNVSRDDARKKAWAKVPGNAQWASETKKQATNQTPQGTKTPQSSVNDTNNAKDQSKKVLKDSSRNSGQTIIGKLLKTTIASVAGTLKKIK